MDVLKMSINLIFNLIKKNNNNELNFTELKDTINLPSLKLYIPYFLNEKVMCQKMMLGNAKEVLRNIFKVTTNIILLPTL